ncbi:MAG: DUF302 domain-containing protein [Candidatus Thorarchaeota archaeon]|nr:MAG: DUF302 domain-containing protein [Candidatus Thorarchaeota archaeon]
MVEVLRKEVDCEFEMAVARVEQAIIDEGFTVLLSKSIHGVLKEKLGIENYPKYTFVLACGPEIAKAAIEVSKDVGTLFPCSFAVYEENESVFVSHTPLMEVAAEVGLATKEAMAPVVEMTTAATKAVWSRF